MLYYRDQSYIFFKHEHLQDPERAVKSQGQRPRLSTDPKGLGKSECMKNHV